MLRNIRINFDRIFPNVSTRNEYKHDLATHTVAQYVLVYYSILFLRSNGLLYPILWERFAFLYGIPENTKAEVELILIVICS